MVSGLATADKVHPKMIHQWKKSPLEGAGGFFERGGQAAVTAEIAKETDREPHGPLPGSECSHA